MKILVLNGPNLNLLGIREPSLYGTETYETLRETIRAYALSRGIETKIYQSNHEGDLVDKIQSARGTFDGILLNAAAYTHTSIAIPDALKAVALPCVEVHLTDPDAREDYRKVNFLRDACFATVKGEGTKGYLHALDLLAERIASL